MAKILLIDDDADLRQFVQDALTRRGHQVRCLDRAENGIHLLAAGEFDLVLVDENMPGMSGSQFLKALRQKQIDLPAILMTGLATGTLVQPMKELGAFVVSKPSGGYGEFWKNLEAVLETALQREAEIVAAMGRTVGLALKSGKTSLVPYLRWLLNCELLVRVSAEVNHNAKEAKLILGVPLTELTEEKPPISFRIEALLLIANHPELKVDQIAARLGCSRATLYRDPDIKRALKSRNAGVHQPPSGSKNAQGDLEAWDE